MIRRLEAFFWGKILFIGWLLLHFVYQLQSEIRERFWWDLRLLTRKLIQCWPSHSVHGEIARLAKEAQSLARIPQHIAISVIDKQPPGAIYTLLSNLNLVKEQVGEVKGQSGVSGESSEGIDLQALAKVISWAWVANIPIISLYDHRGTIKCQYRELSRYVQEELCQNLWAVKRADEPPTLKFHNVLKNGYTNGHSNGTNGMKQKAETLHICLYSNEDGKAGIVRAAKDIFKERMELKSPEPLAKSLEERSRDDEIKEKDLNAKIDQVINWSNIKVNNSSSSNSSSSVAKTEPDLLLILGNIKSTMGFLPWHIRLTEIHWLPPLPKIEMRDLLHSLGKYATCHQRFGT